MGKFEREKQAYVLGEVSEEISESSESIEVPVVEAPKPKPPLIHVDMFLRSAAKLYSMSPMQVAGFKARMNGRAYQYGTEVFEQELKQYLNLK